MEIHLHVVHSSYINGYSSRFNIIVIRPSGKSTIMTHHDN